MTATVEVVCFGAVFCLHALLRYPPYDGPPVVVVPDGGLPEGHRPHWCGPCGEQEEERAQQRWDHHGEAMRRERHEQARRWLA